MSDPVIGEPVVSAVPTAAPWEDLLDIFYAPRQVFERRRDGKYLVPLLALCALIVLVSFLSAQLNDAVADVEFNRAIVGQKLTAEQIATGRAFANKIKAIGIYLVPFFIVIGAWVSGVILMLLCNAMGGKMNFAQGTLVAVLASMPELLSKVLVGAQGLFLDTATVVHRYSFSISAARFMPGDASKWMLKLGAMADPFVLWGAFLTGMGVWIIGRMEKEKAAVLAIINLVLLTLLIR